MNLLLDTHVWLWWTNGDELLNESFKAAIGDEENRIFVSSVVAWEISIKWALGKLKLPDTPARWIPTVQSQQRFEQLPVTTKHAVVVATLPSFEDHKDPFDRLLIAQAIGENFVLATADGSFKRYPISMLG